MKHAHRALRSRFLAAISSVAAHEELLDDMRKSPGRRRIEAREVCERIRLPWPED